MRHPPPTLEEERGLWQQGLARVAGLDEAGRGAWAGPVTAAAVILAAPPAGASDPALSQVRDSKLLTPAARQALYPLICQQALAWGVGHASATEIDQLGIVPATRLAMMRAVQALAIRPDALLIDAVKLPDLPLPQRVLYHADSLCLSVAAASILAKVSRDGLMVELDADYPGYGFAQNKGYGVAAHRRGLVSLGVSPVHRRTYRPVACLLPPSDPSPFGEAEKRG